MKQTLLQKYGIDDTVDWVHKDGGDYLVLGVKHIPIGANKIPVVLYKKLLSDAEKEEFAQKKMRNFFVRTVEHFKSSFTARTF